MSRLPETSGLAALLPETVLYTIRHTSSLAGRCSPAYNHT